MLAVIYSSTSLLQKDTRDVECNYASAAPAMLGDSFERPLLFTPFISLLL